MNYYEIQHKFSWKTKVREIWNKYEIIYRKQNCHEIKQGFTMKGRRNINECRLRAKIYGCERGIDFLRKVKPKDEEEKKQIQETISKMKGYITDFENFQKFEDYSDRKYES